MNGLVTLFALVLLLTGFQIIGVSKAFGKEEIVVCTWGGAGQEAQRKSLYIPFEKETGVKVVEASPPSSAKIKAMVQSGNVEWDLAFTDMGRVLTLMKENLLEKLDYSLVDKGILNQIDKSLIHPYGMAFHYWAVVIAYNTKSFPKDPPKNWKDVWDAKKFPGPRSLKGCGEGIIPNLESALMADGVSLEKVYPIDIERAFKSLDRIKPHVVKWWTSGALPAQLLTDNEAVIVDTYNGRIEAIQKAGAPVAIEWTQGLLDNDVWAIPKGAKNFKNAMKFISFSLRADRQAEYANIIPYGPVNPEAYKLIKSERVNMLPSHPENMKRMLKFNSDWWGENHDKVIEIWNSWMLKK